MIAFRKLLDLASLAPLWMGCFAAAASHAAEPEIAAIPENRLGFRGHLKVGKISWKADHPRIGARVTICKAGAPIIAAPALVEIAKSKGLHSSTSWKGKEGHSKKTIHFEGASDQELKIDLESGYHYFSLCREGAFQRNQQAFPLLVGMPPEEETIRLSLEYLKRIGISDHIFYSPDLRERDGYNIQFGGMTLSKFDPKLGKDVEFRTSLNIKFAQKIGDLPAFWNGTGGRVTITLNDGGQFANVEFCLRDWEPIGECELLTHEDINNALMKGFSWVEDPLTADVAEITSIHLAAYHGRDNEPQKHFPPVWLLELRPAGDQDGGVCVCIPALKQHLDKYPRSQ